MLRAEATFSVFDKSAKAFNSQPSNNSITVWQENCCLPFKSSIHTYNLCASLICTSWLEYTKVWDITRSFGISRDIWQLGFDFWLLPFNFWLLTFYICHFRFVILHLTFTFVLCYICHFNFDFWHLASVFLDHLSFKIGS